MDERTFPYVVVARRDQGLAREADGYAQTSTRARASRPSLAPTPTLLRHLFALVLILSVLLPGVAHADSIDSCLADIPAPTPVTAVHVQPDSGFSPVVDEINQARCTVDLSMYLLTANEVVEALDSAVARGVRVRVILEKAPFGSFGDQQEMFDRLISIGADVKWGPDRFEFSHAKYMILDQSVLLVTNQNFTGAGFNSNREFGVVTTESRYLNEAATIFEADWSGAEFTGEIEHLVVSPVNARETIIDLIDNSKSSVWLYSEVLRDEEVTAALSAAAERGVDVRILVNESADGDDVPYFLDVLSHGVQIRVLPNPYVHSKVMIVDGGSALVGSQNYSYTSLELNREMGIVLTDDDNLAKIVAVYERDWTRAKPVDSISTSGPNAPVTLTQGSPIGRISWVRWRVV